MPKITALELAHIAPKEFQKEYLKWVEHALDYQWWEYIHDELTTRLEPAGVEVRAIHFNISYSQGDYATFSGRIKVAQWMESTKCDAEMTYAQKYLALYLAELDNGAYATMSANHRGGHASVNYDGYVIGNTYPAGVFSGLDRDAWDELVADQHAEADLETAMQKYVNDISDTLYGQLRDEYEHQTSEESFIESCECNDDEFDFDFEE